MKQYNLLLTLLKKKQKTIHSIDQLKKLRKKQYISLNRKLTNSLGTLVPAALERVLSEHSEYFSCKINEFPEIFKMLSLTDEEKISYNIKDYILEHLINVNLKSDTSFIVLPRKDLPLSVIRKALSPLKIILKEVTLKEEFMKYRYFHKKIVLA